MSITIGPWSDPMVGLGRRRSSGCRAVMAVGLVVAVLLGAERSARAQGSPYTDEQPQAAEASSVGDAAGPAADRDPSALSEFRAPLAPYGRWVDDPTYGTIWIPRPDVVGAEFVPYRTAGHWALDDDGQWMWVSDYGWGWAPFHYGRWVLVPGVGWAWIPGRVYAPAWVSWRVGEPDVAFVGWAPVAPEFYWWGGVPFDFAVGAVLAAPFCYAPSVYVFDAHVDRFIVRDPARADLVARHSVEVGRGLGRWAPVSPTAEQAHVPAAIAARAYARPDPRAMAATHGGSWSSRSYGRSLGNVRPLAATSAGRASPRAALERAGSGVSARATTLPHQPAELSRSPAAGARPGATPSLRSLHRRGRWPGRLR